MVREKRGRIEDRLDGRRKESDGNRRGEGKE